MGVIADNHYTLHYVFHAKGNTGNACEAIYNRIDLSTSQNTEYRYTNYPSAYPSLASLSSDSTNQTFLIPYLTSDSTSYPGFRSVACDDNGAWSNDLLIHAGDTTKLAPNWGDYIGAARFHSGILPTCWIYGNYASPNYYDGTESYIAEIILTNPNGISQPNTIEKAIKVFPNPANSFISIDLPIENEFVIISLYDSKGSIVKTLYEGDAKKIPSHITIPKNLKGIYFISITNSRNQFIEYEKIIIE